MKKQVFISGLVFMAGLSSTFAANSIPRSCIEHAIETSFAEPKVPSDMLAVCKDPSGEPVRGGLKKLDKKLITEIATDFNLIADCLDLNAGFYFSKITGESGFQVNTIGPAGDGGIGQLTGVAIDNVNEVLPNYLYRIHHSDNKSCQTLTKLLKTKLNGNVQASSDFKNRCQLINDKENPLRNLLYTMILNDINRRAVNNTYVSHDISAKMLAAGAVLNDDETEQLKSLLAMMGYNMGGANAVRDLESYLDARIEFIARKSKEIPAVTLFSAQLYGMYSPGIRDFLKMVNTDDLNIVEGLEKYKTLRKPHLQELKDQLKDDDKAMQEYEVWLRNISASELSFSEWLWTWQKSRGIAYVNMINNIKNRMDDEMGAGVCTSDRMDRE